MKASKVKLHEGGEKTLELSAALLLYRSHEGCVYATAHDIVPHPLVKNATMLGPGRLASKAALGTFAGAISEAISFRGMVPENLLYTAPNVIAWFTPPQVRRVWFECPDKRVGNASAEVLHPPLVFVATPAHWYVFSVNTTSRPGPAIKLYKAPYFNVYESGRICPGNIDLPDGVGPDSIPAYEDAFFRSRFTHHNDKHLVRYKGGAYALWRDQLQAPDRLLLDVSVLVDRKETFEQAIHRILSQGQQ